MAKYKIDKDLFPFSCFIPPISAPFLRLAVPHMKPPRFIYRDKIIETARLEVKSYDGEGIECFLFAPREARGVTSCLVYMHGGGFVLPAASYHYQNAMHYAKELGCRVLFVNYRLAPTHKFPVFFEDCYAALCYAHDCADSLGIDTRRIGVGGDSAGATLAVGSCMIARDRGHPVRPLFQMLAYPFLDASGGSESYKRYTDTPMWNSKLSERVGPLIEVDKGNPYYSYYSPTEAKSLHGLPPAYIETAEFDCLHDDGVLYAERLLAEGISVALYETRGTMHGFDIMRRAKSTKAALSSRVNYMREMFYR